MNQSPDWSDKTILIVEDDLIARIFYEKTLKDLTQLIFVKNGLDAVETVKTDPSVDLVLMDLKMPVKTGFEATVEIKSIRPSLPVIAQTALAYPQDKKKAKEAGCDDFISKPIEIEILFDTLTRFLG
ncbi:MAG: response regulator [Bacteroidales bacterium]|nr:response regulator [Bacteroidales bacterium]